MRGEEGRPAPILLDVDTGIDDALALLYLLGEPRAKLLGITAMEKLVGKKRFGEVAGAYLVKPEGAPTLVPESDKRPELNTAAQAAEDFKEEN